MLIAKVEQVKTIIKWKMNQSEGAGTIVHKDNCAFFLRSEVMNSRWMKQAEIVTPKSSNALEAWEYLLEIFYEIAFLTKILKGYVGRGNLFSGSAFHLDRKSVV